MHRYRPCSFTKPLCLQLQLRCLNPDGADHAAYIYTLGSASSAEPLVPLISYLSKETAGMHAHVAK
jgi:hypothetical protein